MSWLANCYFTVLTKDSTKTTMIQKLIICKKDKKLHTSKARQLNSLLVPRYCRKHYSFAILPNIPPLSNNEKYNYSVTIDSVTEVHHTGQRGILYLMFPV